jgi:NitT/TauT family transport system substrate-binding protein
LTKFSLRRTNTVRHLAFLAIACALGLAQVGAANAEEPTVKVGWVKALSWTPWAAGVEAVKGLKVDLVPFGSSNEELIALASGSIDMAPVGYNNVAALLAAGQVPARFVSGISAYGSAIIVKKGSGIKDWSDLKGKKVGSVRGSTQYVNLVTSLAQHGLDVNNPKDVDFVSIQNFNDLNIALQHGDVDAIVTFPPLSEQALKAGYAERAPALQKTLYDGSFFVASGILASDRMIKGNPKTLQTILDAYLKQIDAYSKDHVAWIKKYQAITGAEVDIPLFQEAFDNGEFAPYTKLNEAQVRQVADTLFKLKVIPTNTADDLVKHLDYSFLAKATGKTPQQLGKAD